MILRPVTIWRCNDFYGYTFRLWLVSGDFAHMHSTERGCRVSVPVSSFGSRWKEVRR